MRQTLARNWRWFLVAAALLDVTIATVPHVTGDFTNAMLIFPARWLVLASGVFAMRWAHQAGVICKSTSGWAATYFVFGFTAAALLGGAFSA